MPPDKSPARPTPPARTPRPGRTPAAPSTSRGFAGDGHRGAPARASRTRAVSAGPLCVNAADAVISDPGATAREAAPTNTAGRSATRERSGGVPSGPRTSDATTPGDKRMRLFYNSAGTFIASEEGGRLHSRSGGNIGHYLAAERIFIDRSGRYLGEAVLGNRLLDNRRSPYRAVGFAVPGTYAGIGAIGNPGCAGPVEAGAGYADIAADRLE